jgi:hypothetical protein
MVVQNAPDLLVAHGHTERDLAQGPRLFGLLLDVDQMGYRETVLTCASEQVRRSEVLLGIVEDGDITGSCG